MSIQVLVFHVVNEYVLPLSWTVNEKLPLSSGPFIVPVGGETLSSARQILFASSLSRYTPARASSTE